MGSCDMLLLFIIAQDIEYLSFSLSFEVTRFQSVESGFLS
jgi:hypothetical protein